MTNGKYSEVIVDDDMEITVNGQSIETLSGGNETVANIALRLALGQVLVVETFPVFLGDEMDAFADESRREAVAEAMAALLDKGHLKQVILVTHRGVAAADHVIDLGNTE
jgi:DNA repair exonuclease SbcCD ATPase subunit